MTSQQIDIPLIPPVFRILAPGLNFLYGKFLDKVITWVKPGTYNLGLYEAINSISTQVISLFIINKSESKNTFVFKYGVQTLLSNTLTCGVMAAAGLQVHIQIISALAVIDLGIAMIAIRLARED